ncbi:MAG: EFR1 family ferrodoxin [Lachnospiraceae bacterium]|nr:EFR1 family ferrodoxin [Lachnospiraceae bacterium]
MTVYYFTSTGNCLSVAKMLGGNLVSISQEVKKNQIICKDDVVGIVFPVYGLCVPPIICDFLNRSDIQTNYLFAIATYGTFAGAVPYQLEQCVGKKKKHFDYINTLHMQENYLPGFAMEKQKEPKNQKEKTKIIIQDIVTKKQYLKSTSWFERFMTNAHLKNYKYNIGEGYTKSFGVMDICIGCGQCEKLCPMGNVHIQEGKPVFETNCCSCFSCIQNCPQKALQIEGEKGKGRYRNPDVTVAELIEANQYRR